MSPCRCPRRPVHPRLVRPRPSGAQSLPSRPTPPGGRGRSWPGRSWWCGRFWPGWPSATAADPPASTAGVRPAHAHRPQPLLVRLTEIGDLPVLVVGSVGTALVVVGRDRSGIWPAWPAPPWPPWWSSGHLKPFVARRYVGVLTFPSGSVTTVAAWPPPGPWLHRGLRSIVIPVVTVVVGAVAWAVIGLRWTIRAMPWAGPLSGLACPRSTGCSTRPTPPPDAVPAEGIGPHSDPLGAASGHPRL